jgi:hypothetical protein
MENHKLDKAQLFELLSYAYRRIAYDAHLMYFVPIQGAFWSKSVKKRFAAIDSAAVKILDMWIKNGLFCKCGHLEDNHKMPGGVDGFYCTGKDCQCQKFTPDVENPKQEKDRPIFNGNKLIQVLDEK